ncbi:unnamed protein product, partial [Allacma fusca]
MNLLLVTILLVTVAFQQSQSRQLHFQIHHQNKLHSFYDTFTMESHEVQHHLA